MSNPISSAVIVGASSGIGREIARQLAASGTKVCAVARRQAELDSLASEFPDHIRPLVHDVTHIDEAESALQQACDLAGGLDLLVFCSGVMPSVEFHEYSTVKDIRSIEVNVAGMVAWMNAAAKRMEATRHGRLVCIGSRAGARGLGSMPAYSAAKAFQHTFMEAIRNRIARHGVSVVTIMPGPTATEMTKHLPQKGMMDVKLAAQKIIALSGRTGSYYLKPSHRVIVAILKAFPSFLLRRLKV